MPECNKCIIPSAKNLYFTVDFNLIELLYEQVQFLAILLHIFSVKCIKLITKYKFLPMFQRCFNPTNLPPR